MARCGIHARTNLDRADWLHAEALGKIEHVRMVAHQLYTAQRRSLVLPTGDSRVQCSEVGSKIFLENSLVLRVVACQAICDGPGYRLARDRIEVEMRIPHRVYIAQCTVDARRHLQGGNVHRAVDITRSPLQNLRVARCLK